MLVNFGYVKWKKATKIFELLNQKLNKVVKNVYLPKGKSLILYFKRKL